MSATIRRGNISVRGCAYGNLGAWIGIYALVTRSESFAKDEVMYNTAIKEARRVRGDILGKLVIAESLVCDA